LLGIIRLKEATAPFFHFEASKQFGAHSFRLFQLPSPGTPMPRTDHSCQYRRLQDGPE
jgi:hypothetical protein